MQIQIYAPIKGPEGYSVVARDLVVNLSKYGVRVCLEEFKHWGPFEVGLTQEEHKHLGQALTNKPYASRDAVPNLSICLPQQARKIESCRNYLYTMFEANGICQDWVNDIRTVDHLIVPTDFNKQTFHESGVPLGKIKVAPIGYNPDLYNPYGSMLELETGGRPVSSFEHRFLMVCELTNRKNFWGSLHLFCMTADRLGRDRCCLVLKVGNYSKSISLRQEIRDFLQKMQLEDSIESVDYSIFNYSAILSNTAHPMFLRMCNYYLSTSLGEGWDLTAMQSATCGLNIFIPHHSAYQCWAPREGVTFFPIAKKIAAYQDLAVAKFYNGQDWFAFDMYASRDMLANEIQHDQEGLTRKREFLTSYMPKNLSWDSVLHNYLEIL